jgi:hypothetical protein
MLTQNKRGLHLFVSGYTSTSKTTCGVPRLIFMAKSQNENVISSLEMTLAAAKSLTIVNPKTVQFDNTLLTKIKSVATDFPELNLSPTKLLNAIVIEWFHAHRDELINNHIKNVSDRY